MGISATYEVNLARAISVQMQRLTIIIKVSEGGGYSSIHRSPKMIIISRERKETCPFDKRYIEGRGAKSF